MSKDKLLPIIAEIESSCQQNNIANFYGHVENEVGTQFTGNNQKKQIGKSIQAFFKTQNPKQEEEIRKSVLDLKAQGVKKVQIKSRLGISAGKVDKYFDSEWV